MGLFDAVKKMVGGSRVADVSFECENPTAKGTFKVKVTATILENDIEITSIHLKTRTTEEVMVPKVRVAVGSGGQTLPYRMEDVKAKNQIFTSDSTLFSGQQACTAGETYTWEVEVKLAEGETSKSKAGPQPTFNGLNAKHTWVMMVEVKATEGKGHSTWEEVQVF